MGTAAGWTAHISYFKTHPSLAGGQHIVVLLNVLSHIKMLRLLRFSGIIDIMSGDLPKGTKLQSTHLEALIELHNMTSTFGRNIQHLFAESDLPILFSALRAVYSPYETFKVRWVVFSLG